MDNGTLDNRAGQPHHQLRVKGHRGSLEMDVALDLTAPWTVIFGPSGSGKSSLLRAACGLVPGVQVEFRRWRGFGGLTGRGKRRGLSCARAVTWC